MKRLLPLLALFAGCAPLPQDAEGTLGRIAADHVVRIGVAADPRASPGAARALVQRLARAADARATVTAGATEPLLAALEADELDVVIGTFAADTPWATLVTLTPPVARYDIGERMLLVRAAVKNGENRWAMLVEQAARAQAPELAHEG